MIKVYPAVFHEESGSYWVEFPDLEGCSTCGESLEETMELAQEALGLYIVSLSEDGLPIPIASDIKALPVPEDGIVSYVSTNTDRYRKNTMAVKKTVSLPKWLNDEAEKRNISLSKVLQDSLKQQIEI